MYDVYLVTKNPKDKERLIKEESSKSMYLTVYNMNTASGKKDGLKLQSYYGAKKDPFIVVLKQETDPKCFYTEASDDVVGDFLNWFNGTMAVKKNETEVTVRKQSINEKLNEPVTVNIKNEGRCDLPEYATVNSAGMDLRANIEERVVLGPMERKLVPTGLHIALPKGFEAQVRPRSGLALKRGITVLNTPGTIDADYRGEIGVILFNTTDEDFKIQCGDRIAQLVLNKVEQIHWIEVDELDETERGEGGFGSTKIK
jgi:dUTP pyrophosphatase